eukprot:CAMPEP_0181244848 /NCGR_PEP_ID=MMETSP1096-20121128/43091_1 /TAXON_ID=156174 ORGANISM="Chrysochromulina ericina, Strain CCMP281" /NCGR_SAMPLE_ID=MMETSP1096 /ASSEMBLY_ACC=CAM_ASM_000453 /LENGTH=171 /DNA_ID=CAMNT_0023341449 /DNA_START=1 /DNA_END=516 /DNA_ORIENTATION=+
MPHETLRPGKGGWLGELWDPNEEPTYWDQPHHWRTGFYAKEDCRVVAFDRKRLHDFIARSPHMRDAAEAAEIADLWGKLRNSFSQGTRNTYHGMWDMALADGALSERERVLLDKFAQQNPRDLPERDREEIEHLATKELPAGESCQLPTTAAGLPSGDAPSTEEAEAASAV